MREKLIVDPNLMLDRAEREQITCFKFLKTKPNHFIYALRGVGICLQAMDSKDFEEPKETIKGISKEEIVIKLFEHIDKKDIYIYAVTNRAIYCFLEHHQLVHSYKFNKSTEIALDYCERSSKLFFSDGAILMSISTTNRGQSDNRRVEFDLQSKHLVITAVKARWSQSNSKTMVYLGTNGGKVYLHCDGEKLQTYDAFKNQKVTSISYMR